MAAACSGGGVHLDEPVSFVTDLETSIWAEARCQWRPAAPHEVFFSLKRAGSWLKLACFIVTFESQSRASVFMKSESLVVFLKKKQPQTDF